MILMPSPPVQREGAVAAVTGKTKSTLEEMLHCFSRRIYFLRVAALVVVLATCGNREDVYERLRSANCFAQNHEGRGAGPKGTPGVAPADVPKGVCGPRWNNWRPLRRTTPHLISRRFPCVSKAAQRWGFSLFGEGKGSHCSLYSVVSYRNPLSSG
ncbi:hypothetical protein TcBrA4_0124890 [Trypanosoma cruzi]|nr:hypothetical protein TcBrA4_0124890 [Trypanosoma cruzi]